MNARTKWHLTAVRAHLEKERESIAISYCRLDEKLRPKLETIDRRGRGPYRRVVDLIRRIDAALESGAARREDRRQIGPRGASARA